MGGYDLVDNGLSFGISSNSGGGGSSVGSGGLGHGIVVVKRVQDVLL